MNVLARLGIVIALLAPCCHSVAQSRTEYLDPQFNVLAESAQAQARYIRTVAFTPDSIWAVTVSYPTGSLMMTGEYLDKELTIEQGDFQYLYANGVLESEGRYKNGLKVGTWKRWNYDGRPKPDRFYPDENFQRSPRTTAGARFPGGTKELQRLVHDSLAYPDEAKERNIEGTVYVTFVVDAYGEVRQPEISDGVHYLLDEEALRFVSNLPSWSPATRFGVPVETIFVMPITFSIAEEASVSAPLNTHSSGGLLLKNTN